MSVSPVRAPGHGKRRPGAAVRQAEQAEQADPAARVGRRRRGAEDKRAAIRHAAYRCFRSKGYYESTVDDICEAAGISKGSFYWYFSEKQAVLLNILDSWAQDVERAMGVIFRDSLQGADPIASMSAAIEAEARHTRKLMPVWLEFLAQLERIPEVKAGLAQFHRRIRDVIVAVLEPSFPPGLSRHDQERLASVILAGFVGMQCLALVDPQAQAFEDNLRSFMSFYRKVFRL